MKMLRRAILALGFIFFVAAYASAAIQDTSSTVPSIGEKILADDSIFHKGFIESIDLNLLRSDSTKLGYPIPEGQRPKIREIQEKYGEPYIIVNEKAVVLPSNFSIDESARDPGFSSRIWRDVPVYYYGRVGFGIEIDGGVVCITNWVAPKFKNEALFTSQSVKELAAGDLDGNWAGFGGGGKFSFTVVNNVITSLALENFSFLGCGGDLLIDVSDSTTQIPPDGKIDFGISGFTRGNLFAFDFKGQFTSNTSFSASGDGVFIAGSCGLVFGTGGPSLSATKQPDYLLSVDSPRFRSAFSGDSASFTIPVKSLGSFNQPVEVRAAAPSINGVALNLSSNTVVPGMNTTLNVTTILDTPPAIFAIRVTSMTGNVTHTAFAILDVSPFRISISPSSQKIGQGESANFTLETKTGQFNQPINLSSDVSPSGSDISVNFSSRTIKPGESTTFTAAAAPDTSLKDYTITVTGTSDQIKISDSASLTVSPPDFTLSINPTSMTIGQGQSASFTVNVQKIAGFSNPVSLSTEVTPSDGNVNASLSSSTVAPGSSTTLTVSTAANTPTKTFTITVRGTFGQLAHSTTVKVNIVAPDFALAVNPGVQTVVPGKSTSFMVNVQPLAGFAQPVSLSATVAPSDSNVTASFSSSTVMPGSNTILTINTTPNAQATTFTITITGTAGQLVHTTTATLKVIPDFALAINPGSQTVVPGASTSFTVNVQSLGGFAQPVSLSAAVTPPESSITVSFSLDTVMPGGNTTLTINATPSTPQTIFTITVTGTAGQLVHTATAMLNVTAPDFAIIFDPATLNVTRGQKGQITVNINRIGGFAGNVTVTAPDTKAIKVKLTPPMQSTTSTSVSFNFKVKKTAPTGAQQLVFTGKDDSGRVRTGTLTLVIQ